MGDRGPQADPDAAVLRGERLLRGVVDRVPWGDVRKWIVNPSYLYVVWLVVFAGIYRVETTLRPGRHTAQRDGPGAEPCWALPWA
jgi:hypothetical protein